MNNTERLKNKVRPLTTVPQKTTKPAPSLDPKLVDHIVAEVREDEIVSMCGDVINIPRATGQELQMAEYMQAALRKTAEGPDDALGVRALAALAHMGSRASAEPAFRRKTLEETAAFFAK